MCVYDLVKFIVLAICLFKNQRIGFYNMNVFFLHNQQFVL
jgi:hypothetical protein